MDAGSGYPSTIVEIDQVDARSTRIAIAARSERDGERDKRQRRPGDQEIKDYSGGRVEEDCSVAAAAAPDGTSRK